MDIFFRNIPAKTKLSDLEAFAAEGAKTWLSRSEAQISRCEILEITDDETGITEYHGLVSVRDPKVGERMIKKLNRKVFMGKTIAEVREWSHRAPGDRRYREETLGMKKPDDRRRKSLTIEKKGEKEKAELLNYSSDPSWTREHRG